jgi:hypothetical protein
MPPNLPINHAKRMQAQLSPRRSSVILLNRGLSVKAKTRESLWVVALAAEVLILQFSRRLFSHDVKKQQNQFRLFFEEELGYLGGRSFSSENRCLPCSEL